MTDYYFTGNSGADGQLFISPITADVAAAHNMDSCESIGYYLYQKIENDVSILARLPSEEAAFALSRILGLQ